MKKYKVKIPEGYEPGTLEYDTYLDNDGNKYYIAARLTLIPLKKELAKTWEEYRHNNRNILEVKPLEVLMPSKGIESFLALSRLVQLRDHYNDGWEPDWDSDNVKPSIQIWINEVRPSNALHERKLLAFKNHDLMYEFLSNFRDLIETAKPLL